MDITDVFINITPLTISDVEARSLLVDVLKRDLVEVEDEYLDDGGYAYNGVTSDMRTLDDRRTDTVDGPSDPVQERCLRLVPDLG